MLRDEIRKVERGWSMIRFRKVCYRVWFLC